MVKSVAAWQTSDGQLHASEQDAKDHEFRTALAAFMPALWLDIPESSDLLRNKLFKALYDARMQLLPIFKILNGGAPLTGVPSPQKNSLEQT